MPMPKPLPVADADSKPFWDACREHKLVFQKCAECGHVRWPAAVICPQCHSQAIDWVESGGKGMLYTFTVYRQAFHPAFKEDLPYVVAVVELAEGPMFLSNLVECDPAELSCEMPVEVVWDDVSPECTLPKFRPVG